jgi:L-asparaginase
MTVHVIATGGTIASHFDGSQWTEVDGPTLVAELGELPVAVEVLAVAAGPSSNLSVESMVAIAEQVRVSLTAGAQGVVVVHGTDTMELTAFVVQLLLGTESTRRPVVFTGSMRAHSHPTPDGPTNLRDAITVAASDAAVGREVMVCLNGSLHAADRVRKRSAMSVDAFDSAPLTTIGSVDGALVEFGDASPVRSPATSLVGPVPLVTCYPGIDGESVAAVIGDAPGVVVEGFGDLNVPHALWGAIHAAGTRGALVVVASGAFTTNRGDDLREFGAIGAGGLSAQKARLAVMAALGSTASRDDAIEFVQQYGLAHDAGDRRTTP